MTQINPKSKNLDVLVIGGGGREHAIVKKLNESGRIGKLYAAPGNAGIAGIAECFPYKTTDIDGLASLAKKLEVGLVFVAPDDPLSLGLVDRLSEMKIPAFGPTKKAAELEGSKVFSKNLMKKYNIPTADYEIFDNSADALKYIKNRDIYPTVVKADGLALGKGAVIAADYSEAELAVLSIMEERIFGDSGNNIVVEEFLTGPEVTVLTFVDGKTVKPMISSQDHKRVYDDDAGPNTGGMGAFAPSPLYTAELADKCMKDIFVPTVRAMESEGRLFKGIIYFQLMLTSDGPKVIEYNARFGDPETQVVLPLLKTDLLDIIDAVIEGRLDEIEIKWSDRAATCVVAASGGYPIKHEIGYEISGLDDFACDPDITIYHAGTKLDGERIVTAGGRVLGVTALGDTLNQSVKKAYLAIERISFTDMHYRRDIGKK